MNPKDKDFMKVHMSTIMLAIACESTLHYEIFNDLVNLLIKDLK